MQHTSPNKKERRGRIIYTELTHELMNSPIVKLAYSSVRQWATKIQGSLGDRGHQQCSSLSTFSIFQV